MIPLESISIIRMLTLYDLAQLECLIMISNPWIDAFFKQLSLF